MPKINILLNGRGQPVGKSSRQLSSVIGCQVRKNVPLCSVDWRLVDAEKKYKLWTDVKAYYNIDDIAFNWVMRTAGKKWKEFKSTLKELYFDPQMNLEECAVCPDKRVNDGDWKFLVTYWKTSEFQARSEIAQTNRSKLELHHTSGSISYAFSEYDLAVKLGRPPRRDENFIKTHTRKNGVATQQAEPIINKLKAIVEARPELKDKTIQEGDAFAAVCGDKEPRGYVRVLGLGPTPQDIGTPGLKSYVPTRLQMEIFARRKAESEKAALEQHVLQLQAQMEQRAQQDRESVEPMSHDGSTSRQHLNINVDEIGDAGSPCEDDDECYDEEADQHLVDQALGADSSRPAGHITRTNDTFRSEHQALVGKDVILYALLRSDQPVAKGTIISTKPSIVLGGEPLGREFCEVIISCVLKRDAILPRPYADIQTMGDALMMSLAWPYKRLKICGKASTPPASGNAVER